MLERETDLPEGWQLYWIERTWIPLNLYLNLLSCILSFTIVILGLAGWFIGRGASRRLKKNPSERIAITTRMHKKLEKVTKSHFAIAITYLLHAFALALVDGFIAVLALRQDFKSNGDEYDSDAWVEIGIYVVYLTVLFAASFFFVPLLQMLLVTWSLARFKRSRNCSTLADYIPEARFLSTVIAQVWCMATFYVTWSSPDGESFCSTFRFVILQACVGSSTAWLQASFAFNFCADAIENVDARSGVQNALSMFKKTAVIVYTNPSEKEKLPRYEDEPSQPSQSGEKC